MPGEERLDDIRALPNSLRNWAERVEMALQDIQARKSIPKVALVIDSVAGSEVPQYQITLDQDWHDTERGNILLMNSESERFNAWLSQGDDLWLEITWVPDNYPSLNVTVVRCTPEEMWRHLVKAFDETTMIRKLNLGDHTAAELEAAWAEKEEDDG